MIDVAMYTGHRGVLLVDTSGRFFGWIARYRMRQLAAGLGHDVVFGELKLYKKCGMADCVCDILHNHKRGCRLHAAAACPVSFPCDHGLDVCLVCDPCTCKEIP